MCCVVDSTRDQRQSSDLPLPEHHTLAAPNSLLTGSGGFPPASPAQLPSSLLAPPPRVSNLLPPPPRVGTQNAGIETGGRDGGSCGAMVDRAAAQESRLTLGLIMNEGWLPPRHSQHGHQTDRDRLGRGGRPLPHRGFGRRSLWQNRHHAYHDRSYPPRRHQRASDESTRYDDNEPEDDDRWPSSDAAGNADQLPDDDSLQPPDMQLHSETGLHAAANREGADVTVASSSAAPNPDTLPPS